jgi:YcaO-like protein with predicted kinase domain
MRVPNSDLAFKAYFSGTHRFSAPGATLDRVRPLFSQFGITRVANLTGLDRIAIPVVMVCRPNSRSSAVFHGKGIELVAAKASGVMEAIETWHAENAQLPLRFATFDQLSRRYELCDINKLPKRPNVEFRKDLPLLWVEGRNLISGAATWVPFELVHAHSTVSGPPSTNCFPTGTNGLASGNHFLEAVSHALCEVVERDATSLWRRCRAEIRDRMRVDPETIDDPNCRSTIEVFKRAQLDIGIWDASTDVGVPTFQCVLLDRTQQFGHIGEGAGCHPSRDIALSRALTEAAQVRMTYILGSREDIVVSDYANDTLALRNLTANEKLRRLAPGRHFHSVETRAFESFDEEVDWLVGRLAAIGLRQVIIVDLTQAEFDLPVVRAIVPGLEGSDHHPAYTPGARAKAAAQADR